MHFVRSSDRVHRGTIRERTEFPAFLRPFYFPASFFLPHAVPFLRRLSGLCPRPRKAEVRLFRKFASTVGSFMHIFTPVLSFPRFPQIPATAAAAGEGNGKGRCLETRSYATFDTVPPGQGPLDPVSGRSRGTALGVVARDQLAETFRFGCFQRCARAHSPGTLASRTRTLTRRRDTA